MGPIQSGINQSLGLLSVLSSQNPAAQELRKNRGELSLGKHQEKVAQKEIDKQKQITADNNTKLIDRDPETGLAVNQKKVSALEMQKDAAEKLGDYKTANKLKSRIEKGKEVVGRFGERVDQVMADKMANKATGERIRQLEEQGYTPEEIQMIESSGMYPEDIQPIVQKATQEAQAKVQQKKVRQNTTKILKDRLVRKQNMKEDAFNRKDIVRKMEER